MTMRRPLTGATRFPPTEVFAWRLAFGLAALIALASCATAPDSAKSFTIRLNQVGFEVSGTKLATAALDSPQPLPWRVIDARGSPVLDGVSVPLGADAASGETVHLIDMTALVTGGVGYRLEIGDLESRRFTIRARPFAKLKYDALSYFYQNRAGMPITADHVERRDLARPAGHARELAACFSGSDQRGAQWPGCDYTLDVTGGWYDAGDHGKYVVNGGIAVWTLVNVYERANRLGHAPFADGQVDIPEAGDGVDDLLNEARYELDFLMRMQIPEGATAWVRRESAAGAGTQPLVKIDAGGMAHHKVHDRNWTQLPLAPADAPRERLLYPPSTAATLNLAAVAAQCGRVWRSIDDVFAAKCLDAARRAWRAAQRHPDVLASGAFDGGGAYGDGNVADEFYWAAAELLAATGEPEYLDVLKQSRFWLGGPDSGASATGDPGWRDTAALGAIMLATATTSLDAGDRETVRHNIVNAARTYLSESTAQGYGFPRAGTRFEWGSNGALMNRAMILGVAHEITGDAIFRYGAIRALDYVLGRNPMDRSFISGWGARPMQNPHHRFWAHAASSAYPRPPSGALSGGPNNTAMADNIAKTMVGACAPLTCWADHIDAYALNEVAINWNAPLVWVATFVDPDPLPGEQGGRD